jgi:hypothetical protein
VSRSRDTPLLSLAEVLAAINLALLAADADPLMATDDVRDELVGKFLDTVRAMTKLRAHSPGGKRAKAIALQLLHERLQPEPGPFVDLAISLCLDHARPLQRTSR